MYKLKSTFITRLGQFRDGVQEEAVGIKKAALVGDGVFELQIGKDKIVYFADKLELRQSMGRQRGFITWPSPKGSEVAIFPLSFFHKKENPQASLF